VHREWAQDRCRRHLFRRHQRHQQHLSRLLRQNRQSHLCPALLGYRYSQ
jgi:hypothetical protein